MKILFLYIVPFLLFAGGCSLPSLKNPFMIPCRIVPACSGRITDLKGKPLSGVKVRIFSYDKISTTISNADGHFSLSPLYKWVGFQDELFFYELKDQLSENESIAGRRHLLLGELALFFETPKEHFLLLGANYFPAKYKNFQDHHIGLSYTPNMLYLCIPEQNRNSLKVPYFSEPQPWCFYNVVDWGNDNELKLSEKVPPNPWDHLYYKLYKRIGWEIYKKERKIIAPQTVVTLDDAFIQWMKSKAISKKMLKVAEENLKDPVIQSRMGFSAN